MGCICMLLAGVVASTATDASPRTDARAVVLEDIRQSDLRGLVADKLDAEIELLGDLLARLVELGDACDDAPEVRLRLADLHWEKSKRAFFELNETGLLPRRRAQVQATFDREQQASIAGYRRILEACPEHTSVPRVSFLLAGALVEMDDHEAAALLLRRIVREHSHSRYVGNAWLMLGFYFFDARNDAGRALVAFVRAEELGEVQTRVYAVFMQGWCFINQGKWRPARKKFEQVIRLSTALDERARLSLRREASSDFVRAFAHDEGPQNAAATFAGLVAPDEVAPMMEKLAAWYGEAGAHRHVVAVYRALIASNPDSSRVPLYWSRLVETLSIVDRPAAVTAAARIHQSFTRAMVVARAGDAREQQRVARDLVEARDVAESTLRKLASSYHADATKLRGRAKRRALRMALTFYKHYADLFDDWDTEALVRMSFNRAEALYELEDFEQAAAAYERVIELADTATGAERKLIDTAVENSLHALREWVTDEDRVQRQPDRKGRRELSARKKLLIRAALRYVRHFGWQRNQSVAAVYLVGYLYYEHGQFESALPVFQSIVERAPNHDKACEAANLVLDIYSGTARYTQLRDAARDYRGNRALACDMKERRRIYVIEQEAAFKVIELADEAGQHQAAAQAYLGFVAEYPRSELADDAMLNAGTSFERAGMADEAIDAWRTLAEKMPRAESVLVRDSLFNIARLYERMVYFVDAARFLEVLARRFPNDPRSRDALHNASVYRAKLDHATQARRDREMFIARYPNDPATPVMAMAHCQAEEEDADSVAAYRSVAKCWGAYARDWQAREPDGSCHARFRFAKILGDELGDSRGAARERTRVIREWNRVRRMQDVELPRCVAAIAQLKLESLAEPLIAYRRLKVATFNVAEPSARRRFFDSLRAKGRARDALVARYQRVVELGQAEWSLAALFFMGEIYRDAVDKTLAAPIPTDVDGVPLPEDLRDKLRIRLIEIASESETSAVKLFRLCVSESRRLSVFNRWSTGSARRLRELRPADYRSSEKRLAASRLSDRLTVIENGFVVPDRGGWKSLDLDVK